MLLSNVDWKRKAWSKMMFSNVQERKGSLLQFILDFDCKGHRFVFVFFFPKGLTHVSASKLEIGYMSMLGRHFLFSPKDYPTN